MASANSQQRLGDTGRAYTPALALELHLECVDDGLGERPPLAAGEFARQEADFNVQWKVPEGMFKGLMVRLRYAQVSQDDPVSDDLKDLRIMVFYDPPSL